MKDNRQLDTADSTEALSAGYVRKDLVVLESTQSLGTAAMKNHLSTWSLQSHTQLALSTAQYNNF